jgi:hypothetical protein
MFRRPAFVFPSTVIGFKLDKPAYIPTFATRNTERGGPGGSDALRPLTGTFSLQNHPRWGSEKAPMRFSQSI